MRKNTGMKHVLTCMVVGFACWMVEQAVVVSVAQEQWPRVAKQDVGPAEATKPGVADGAVSPALTGARRPLYRLRTSDVLGISFTFAPEFDQTVNVLPDGFITLKGLEDQYAEGMTLPELRERVRGAYAIMLHDPEVTIVLKEFDKPYFIATGQVTRPGKYELRSDITVTEAVAIAGGFTGEAKHSQVVLFRRLSDERIEARLLDVKQMLKSRSLEEDVHLKPGDLLFVPQNTISKVRRYLPTQSLGMYWNPTRF